MSDRRKQIYDDGVLKDYSPEALYFLHNDLKNSAERQLRHNANLKHECKLCGKRMNRKTFNHAFIYHGSDYLNTCPICLEKDIPNFMAHYRVTHFGDVALACNQCTDVYYAPKDLNTHILKHSLMQTTPCLKCNFHFPSEEAVLEHIKADHKRANPTLKKKPMKTLTCEFCGHVATSTGGPAMLKDHLNQHIKAKHGSGEKAFKCTLCPKAFHLSHQLSKHHIRKHTSDENRPFVCHVDNCNKRFKDQGNLVQHQKYHKPPRFKCEKCLKQFYWMQPLKTHKCPAVQH